MTVTEPAGPPPGAPEAIPMPGFHLAVARLHNDLSKLSREVGDVALARATAAREREEALQEAGRQQVSEAPAPIVLSLPQVPEGAVALRGGARWVRSGDYPDMWVLEGGSTLHMLGAVLDREEGSVTVEMPPPREPRAWPKLDGAPDDVTGGNVTSLIAFLGGRPGITEEEVLARIAQEQYYDALLEKGRQFNDVLERAVRERVDEPADEGSPLFDARVLLGLDGATGARDINAEATR